MTVIKKPFYPFLLAVFPILFLFSYNIHEAHARDLLLPIIIAIIGTAIIFLLAKLVTKDHRSSGVITFWFLVLFFSYGHIRDLIYSLSDFGLVSVNIFLEALYILLFIVGTFLIWKFPRDFQTLTKFLNITVTILVMISFINISIYEIRIISTKQHEIGESSITENQPDIYYIIFDSYDRESTFLEAYNYDNSEFTDYLTSKGFYVAPSSRCNYVQSIRSVASSLNMRYIEDERSNPELIRMYQDSEVSQFLKSRGYRYLFVGHSYWSKGLDRHAEVLSTEPLIWVNNFAGFLINSTAAAPILTFIGYREEAALILSFFDTLGSIPSISEPTFVYAHIVCPHGGFIFDRHGNITKPPRKAYTHEELKDLYVEQVIYLNTQIKILVDSLLEESNNTIIIIQADHGSRWDKVRQFDILNAYYFPGDNSHLLYEDITPVNSFRVIFNLYFGMDYDLLEDKSYNLDLTPATLQETSKIGFVNPYTGGIAYKGQLHAHSTNSILSILSPTQLETAYRDIGYDFMAITDYDSCGIYPTPDPGVDEILHINGIEDTSYELGSSSHMLGIGLTEAGTAGKYTTAQATVDGFTAEGALSFLAHPDLSNVPWTNAKIAGLTGFTGIEVYNPYNPGDDTSEDKWDYALTVPSLRPIWGIAVDDFHEPLICLGSSVVARGGTFNPGQTGINLDNPSTVSGEVIKVTLRFTGEGTATGVEVGTFYLVSGTTYKCRDSEEIGNVTKGSKQYFDVDIDIEVGDFIGVYATAGDVGYSVTGGTGIRYATGEYIDPNDQADFTGLIANAPMNLQAFTVTVSDFGWVVVYSDSLTSPAILSSLESGNFYASTGPDMTITTSLNTISVVTSSSSTITWKTQGGFVAQTDTGTTSSSYTTTSEEGYIRTVITRDYDGKKAWSQPLFIREE